MALRRTLLFLLLTGGVSVLPAQPVGPRLEVAAVRFGPARDPAGAAWLMAEVELRVVGAGSGRAQYVDGVQVTLNLATTSGPRGEGESAGTGVDDFAFYRASATAVTLAPGRALFRYYLPPAVVERDRLQGEPRFWVVEVRTGDGVLPASRRSVGPGFTSPAALENFRRQLAQRAPPNDGVLVPWFLSPFPATADPSAPAVLRREAAAVQP